MELVERGPQLQLLSEYAHDAASGDGRCVLIAGEAGAGKTALVEAFQAGTPSARWLWGRCDGLFTPRPLGPVFDIAAQTKGSLADAVASDSGREQLFSAFLQDASGVPSAPIAIVIEDLHWADEATLDLVRYAARRIARRHTILVATYRDDELGRDHPLRVLLGELASLRSIRRMALPPLSVEGIRQLSDAQADAEGLYDLTGGNPFFVRELLDADSDTVPTTVSDAVLARAMRLPAGSRETLEAAAVVGTHVDIPILRAVVHDANASLDACVEAGMLRSDGPGLRFGHELTRLAIESALPAHRRQELHARALRALESNRSTDDARLAFHAASAGDDDAVLRYAPEAARRAAALGAHREAAAQYTLALDVAVEIPDERRASLLESFCVEALLVERVDEALARLDSALEIRERTGDALRAGDDLQLMGVLLTRAGRGSEASEALVRALAMLESLPAGPELAACYVTFAIDRVIKGDRTAGLEACEKAIDLAERLELPGVLAGALDAKGWILTTGRDESGWALLERALEISLEADLHDAAACAYVDTYTLGVELHLPERVEHLYSDGLAYCEEHDVPLWAYCLVGARARAMLDAGRLDDAFTIADGLIRDPRSSTWNRVPPTTIRATVLARRGDPGAWAALDEGLTMAEATSEPGFVALSRRFRAEIRWFEGRPEDVISEIEQIYWYALREDIAWLRGELAVWLRRAGALDEAPPDIEEPFSLEFRGDLEAAARSWLDLGCPYEAAVVRSVSGDEAQLRMALEAFREMGGQIAAAATERKLRAMGVRGLRRAPRATNIDAPHGLTAREHEVLQCLVAGMSNAEIADRLYISPKTVDHHVSAVLSKIGVHSRGAAAREGVRLGLNA